MKVIVWIWDSMTKWLNDFSCRINICTELDIFVERKCSCISTQCKLFKIRFLISHFVFWHPRKLLRKHWLLLILLVYVIRRFEDKNNVLWNNTVLLCLVLETCGFFMLAWVSFKMATCTFLVILWISTVSLLCTKVHYWLCSFLVLRFTWGKHRNILLSWCSIHNRLNYSQYSIVNLGLPAKPKEKDTEVWNVYLRKAWWK